MTVPTSFSGVFGGLLIPIGTTIAEAADLPPLEVPEMPSTPSSRFLYAMGGGIGGGPYRRSSPAGGTAHRIEDLDPDMIRDQIMAVSPEWFRSEDRLISEIVNEVVFRLRRLSDEARGPLMNEEERRRGRGFQRGMAPFGLVMDVANAFSWDAFPGARRDMISKHFWKLAGRDAKDEGYLMREWESMRRR